MNGKEWHEFKLKNLPEHYKLTAEEIIMQYTNKLINALYLPVGNSWICDEERLKKFNIDSNEPINWGDLHCCDVKKFADGTYLVTIEEAAPKECGTFCSYLVEHLKADGWNCSVETEW